jgi:hypothetical protein
MGLVEKAEKEKVESEGPPVLIFFRFIYSLRIYRWHQCFSVPTLPCHSLTLITGLREVYFKMYEGLLKNPYKFAQKN